MTKASGLIAGQAITGSGLPDDRIRQEFHFPGNIRTVCPDPDNKMSRIKLNFQAPLKGGPKAEIDIVPKYRGIKIPFTHGSGNQTRVFMPLDNFQTGLKSSLIKKARHLTKSASPIGDKAAFSKFPPDRITPTPGGPAELTPEAKDPTRRNHGAMQGLRRNPKILNLPRRERKLNLRSLGPKLRSGLTNHR